MSHPAKLNDNFSKVTKIGLDAPFRKTHKGRKPHIFYVLFVLQAAYRPQRKYRRQDADKLDGEEMRVQSTLLEYGQ